MRPVIGITSSTHAREHEGDPPQVASVVNVAYARSVVQVGGLPVLLPNACGPDDAEEILAHVDGLLLSGGGDVDPARWREAPHPRLGKVDAQRDALEIALLHEALRRDLPVFGICRGVQVMAVAHGGALWQDLPDQVGTGVGHYQQGRAGYGHEVCLKADALLARVLHPDGGPERLRVNSFHHQAARAYGALRPVAWSDDGVVEGLEAPGATFALGVQWHPEDLTAHDPVQVRLFAAFVEAARTGGTRSRLRA